MTDTKKPDFEKLRAKRNASVQVIISLFAEEHGVDPAEVQSTIDWNACYCACPNGPCEHNWQGWRNFEDGSGGETICKRCGAGAMSHSLRTAL